MGKDSTFFRGKVHRCGLIFIDFPKPVGNVKGLYGNNLGGIKSTIQITGLKQRKHTPLVDPSGGFGTPVNTLKLPRAALKQDGMRY